MKLTLEQSYDRCQQIARQAASNFYPCFRVLPEPKRQAMNALYAFFRQTDDITDDETSASIEQRRERLHHWRVMLEATLAGEAPHELSPALHDTVGRYAIPPKYLYAALDGAAMDLEHIPYESIEELLTYCYRVASTVGLACIHVWGFRDDRAIEPATQCGYAFQLTNILRDIKEDAQRDRIYLPQADLRQFEYSAEELSRGVINDRYRRLIAFETERTAGYYQQARELTQYLHPDGQRIYRVMLSAYHCLFQEIGRRHGDVFTRRVSLSWSNRLRLAAGIWLSPSLLPGRCS